jgi:L-aminopeptidase/D-esterase-like protein
MRKTKILLFRSIIRTRLVSFLASATLDECDYTKVSLKSHEKYFMLGLRVGHYTNENQGTGASVFLFEKPALAAYWLCGSSPASHELGALELDANVTHINGLALLGGSAFGLSAVSGVMRWLQEQGQGWVTPHGRVPIVPAAAIYDLAVKDPVPPSADAVYQACLSASVDNVEAGRVGAGTGASVGKLVSTASRMTGGIGREEVILPDGVRILVYAVVNSVGDVYDHAKIIAGARFSNGEFANCQAALFKAQDDRNMSSSNTTLVALFTDAKLTKLELRRIAKMATAGMARAIAPAFTRYDGDIVFAVSLGEKAASEIVIGTVAAEMTRQAIVNAVNHSVILQ